MMARGGRRGLLLGAALPGLAAGCSNLLVPRGSSSEDQTIITYSTDNPGRFGDVVRWPAAAHKDGDLREIFDFDSGRRLGAIPQPEVTYNVVSNTNEHQLSIGETTFGGLEMLDGSDGGPDFGPGLVKAICDETYGCIDYGSMIYVTLQRARTAREAILTIDHLMQTYGYASSGESFSIADKNEVWLMEMIGKGNFSKGAVWVATRVPDGYVSAHANQARTRTFRWDDPENVLYAKDVAEFARSIGVYSGPDSAFSFSDTYDPVTFQGARFCEARVFSFFASVAAPEVRMEQYVDYVMGRNLSNRMPLFVKAGHRLSVNETMWHMRNHYEATPLDPSHDVGAATWSSPYRLGEGMIWEYGGAHYVNERMIGVEKAAMNIVATGRPSQRFGVLWFGVDDSSFSLHTPLYGVTTKLPASWDGANCTGRALCREGFGLPGTITKFSLQSMHWVGQLVANYAYSNYAVIGSAVREKLVQVEAALFNSIHEFDLKLNHMSPSEAAAAASDFSYKTAEANHAAWLEFYGELFATFVDGYRMVPNSKNTLGGCDKEAIHWDDSWKKRIVEETGSRYRIPGELLSQQKGAKEKLKLAALSGYLRSKATTTATPSTATPFRQDGTLEGAILL